MAQFTLELRGFRKDLLISENDVCVALDVTPLQMSWILERNGHLDDSCRIHEDFEDGLFASCAFSEVSVITIKVGYTSFFF